MTSTRNNSQPEIQELMYVHRAAEILCCHKATVYQLIQEGELLAVRLGARGVRIVKESLIRYQERNRIDPEEYFK